jgi:hypothetical protein
MAKQTTLAELEAKTDSTYAPRAKALTALIDAVDVYKDPFYCRASEKRFANSPKKGKAASRAGGLCRDAKR